MHTILIIIETKHSLHSRPKVRECWGRGVGVWGLLEFGNSEF